LLFELAILDVTQVKPDNAPHDPVNTSIEVPATPEHGVKSVENWMSVTPVGFVTVNHTSLLAGSQVIGPLLDVVACVLANVEEPAAGQEAEIVPKLIAPEQLSLYGAIGLKI